MPDATLLEAGGESLLGHVQTRPFRRMIGGYREARRPARPRPFGPAGSNPPAFPGRFTVKLRQKTIPVQERRYPGRGPGPSPHAGPHPLGRRTFLKGIALAAACATARGRTEARAGEGPRQGLPALPRRARWKPRPAPGSPCRCAEEDGTQASEDRDLHARCALELRPHRGRRRIRGLGTNLHLRCRPERNDPPPQGRPHVLGADPADFDAISDRAIEANYKFPWSFVCRALAGVDTAIWDLLGKRAGKSVCALLGGTPRPIPVYGSSMSRTIQPADEGARLARLRDEKGFRAFKVRIGKVNGHDQDERPGGPRS